MKEDEFSQVMQMMGRLDQRITGVADDLRDHNNRIEDHLKEDDLRIDKIERWMHDERIRGEEREKYGSRTTSPSPPQVANINLDPKITKGIITLLAAATSFLIFLQTQGGA